jgi:hypothetical protein
MKEKYGKLEVQLAAPKVGPVQLISPTFGPFSWILYGPS